MKFKTQSDVVSYLMKWVNLKGLTRVGTDVDQLEFSCILIKVQNDTSLKKCLAEFL